MNKGNKTSKKGFTLLELLMALGIMGVIVVFAIGISHSIRNMTKVNETTSRMKQIAAKAKEFYRGHEELPEPGTTPDNSIPVEANAFNMEQKYRLDAWGQYFYYNRIQNSSNIEIDQYSGGQMIVFPVGTRTLIRGIIVNGRNVAGVIISYGPNQTEDFTTSGADPVTYTLNPGSDDIIIPIDVSQEAIEITSEELKELQSKVKAFDAIYEGIDNDGDQLPDCDDSFYPVADTRRGNKICDDGESTGCAPHQSPAGSFPTTLCPPTGVSEEDNDPNCGTATLDAIKADRYADSCPGVGSLCPWGSVDTSWTSPPRDETDDDEARAFLYCLYSLADSTVVDPWINGYVWGCSNDIIWGCGTYGYETDDPRYHKFFSAGPDGVLNTADDIIP